MSNQIFPKGGQVSANFTGTAFVSMLVLDEDNTYNCQAYDVLFEAGARNAWHAHPGGQLLFVTDGKGYYQEKGCSAQLLQKGDVVQIPPNVVHWHGAAPDSDFTHIGVSPNTQKGGSVWFSLVTDEEYTEATGGKANV